MLALVATNIGGGIVGMPFAMYNCGAILGCAIIVIVGFVTYLSVYLLMKTKDMSPGKYESLYESGYAVMGRWSIFIICGILFMTTFGTVTLYFVIFGDTFGSVLRQLIIENDFNTVHTEEEYAEIITEQSLLVQILCSREAAIILLALSLLSVVFKRALQELTFLSYVFLASVFGLILLSAIQLISVDSQYQTPMTSDELISPKWSMNIVSSINIIIFAFSFQFQIFPAYVELQKRSTEKFLVSAGWSIAVCCFAYLCMGMFCVGIFGHNIDSDLLLSFGTLPGGVSIFLRLVFSILLMIHIPFVFMPTREFALVIHDEIMRKSLSSHLEKKLEIASKKAEVKKLAKKAGRKPQEAQEDSDEELLQND